MVFFHLKPFRKARFRTHRFGCYCMVFWFAPSSCAKTECYFLLVNKKEDHLKYL